MEIRIIAAVSEDGVVGVRRRGEARGSLPWTLPDDMRYFARMTQGCGCIMGRRTFESIPGRLAGRGMIVLSRTRSGTGERGEVYAPTMSAATNLAGAWGGVCWVIGGTAVWAEALPRASLLYLTRVATQVEALAIPGEVEEYTRLGFDPRRMEEWEEIRGNTRSDLLPGHVMRVGHRAGREVGFTFEVWRKVQTPLRDLVMGGWR